MKKEELRKVKAKIEFLNINAGPGRPSTVETNGYFHKWMKETFSGDEGLHYINFALIEFEDGKMKRVDPEKIQFVDEF